MSDGEPEPAEIGTYPEAWQQVDRAYISKVYYGDGSDRGTLGHRLGVLYLWN